MAPCIYVHVAVSGGGRAARARQGSKEGYSARDTGRAVRACDVDNLAGAGSAAGLLAP